MAMSFREELERGVIRLDESKLKRDITREMANKEQGKATQVMLKTELGTSIEEFATDFMKLKNEGLNFIATFNNMDFDSSFYSSEETIVEAYEKHIREKKATIEVEEQEKNSTTFNIKNANYDQLLARRNEIKLALEEALASPVRDNKKIDELKKELEEIDKAIAGLELSEDAAQKEDEKTTEEENQKEEEVKDEQDLSEKERQEKEAREVELKQAYYDAMVKFYAIRKENAIKLASNKDLLVNTSEEYLQEIKAEDAMYKARDEYLKLGKADPYAEERQLLREQEKQLEKENMARLNSKTQEYRKLEQELAKLQKMRVEKEEEIANAIKSGATQTIIDELNADLREIDYKINNTKQEIIKVKEGLSQAMEILESRRDRRRELSLETREYGAQSTSEQFYIRKAQNREAISRNDYAQATKLENSSIEKEVQRNEERYEQLKKQLKEVKEKEPDNFEKRLALLEQLDDASQQLKASKEVQKDIERGIEPDTDEAIKKAEKDYKSAEERKEDFVKQADDLIAAAKAQERTEGENTVEDTFGASTESQEKKEVAEAIAIGAAAVIDGKNGDSLGEDVVQAAVISEALGVEEEKLPPAPCPIASLNNPDLYKPINSNTEEGIEAARETIEMNEKAAKDAEQIEQHAIEQIEG